MNHKEYLRLRRQIEDKYRADIDALERVYALSQPAGRTDGPKVEGLTEAVKGLLRDLEQPFTVRSVIGRLRETHPQLAAAVQNPTVSTILKRLEGNEIQLVERGSGKRPSSYRAAEPEALPLNE